MKILIVSDSHGNTQKVLDLIKQYPNMDLYLHAGDSQESEYALFPFQTVKGNCDYDSNMNERFMTDTPFGKLLMKHKPNITKFELDAYRIKIFVFGHLHKRCFYQEEGIYYVSPGSISYERDKYNEGYLIINIEKDKIECNFFDI